MIDRAEYFIQYRKQMKRDMDLIREILLVAESDGAHKSPDHYTQEEIAYHVQLLLDARMIQGNVMSEYRDGRQIPIAYVIARLTMDGHDFIDASRENKIWEKAKNTFKEKGVGWTVDILKTVCIQAVKSHIGLP